MPIVGNGERDAARRIEAGDNGYIVRGHTSAPGPFGCKIILTLWV
jgi:hypothetical protein